MKNSSPFCSRQRAFALVIVLGLVVLMVILVAGFLFRASTERTASGGYAASVIARQLADKTVSVVQAQINEAATRGSNVAWVSQPGMVRTLNTSGNLLKAYKLYSASDMISDSVSLTSDLPPANWAADSALWVDLNAPMSANGITNYPIMDPTAALSGGGVGPVEGFAITAPPGATTAQPAPMPVKWLYVLEDGTMAAPAGSGNSATVTGASSSNPIVGRVAFWTDDDSTKININTASEGSYWDTPRGYINTEVYDLALKQPVYGEYNRFPGHPATTSLSAVLPILPALPPLANVPTRTQRDARTSELATRLERYLKLTPDYAFGGSKGGTVPIDPSGASTKILTAIDRKKERLYSSVDELLFGADRTPNDLVTRELLESRRFFLTAHSRAPETNLFNLPRVASWPIYRLGTSRNLIDDRTSVFDRTIALCASTGQPGTTSFEPYFFQRELNLDPFNDYANIPRNQELYAYLQKLAESSIPGFGGNFLTKYGADRDQILTEIFDYIRCTNLFDDLLGTDKQFTTDYHKGGSGGEGKNLARRGGATVAPIQIGGTMGQGRYFGLSQLGIVFIACADGNDSSSNDPATNPMLKEPFPAGPATAIAPTEKRVQAMIVPTFFSTMIGWRLMGIYSRIEIDGLDTLTLDGKPLGFPATGWFEQAYSPHGVSDHSGYQGGVLAPHAMFYKVRTNMPASMPLSSAEDTYPFISWPVTTVNRDQMRFEGGGPITIRLYVGNDAPGHSPALVQTITLQFPAAQVVPTPSLYTNGSIKYWTFFSDVTGLTGRLKVDNASQLHHFINNGTDVARSMTAFRGDFRLTGGLPVITVADGLYARHPDYTSPSVPWAMLWPGKISTNGNLQRLVTGSAFDNDIAVPFPLRPADLTGDFDNGTVLTHFGGVPAVNKPDEGQIYRGASSYPADGGAGIPYYADRISNTMDSATFFSPNRLVPSPVVFGSLPSRVMQSKSSTSSLKNAAAWRTLLFRPAASHETTHSSNSPRDHLLLDLFWMPVVEPYVISDRFSTAGKINMNYQILPFTYIERSTPLRAVLKNEKMAAIPTGISENNAFKPNINSSGAPAPLTNYDFRKPLDVDQILTQFKQRFDQANKNTNIFVSASEICDLHMVPQGETVANMAGPFWVSNRMTGDNLRERIYGTVYPRLTTKSNTYTVHFRAQALKKVPGTPAGSWVEGRDAVRGEYRGSTTIERFINPDANIPDYAGNAASLSTLPTLDTFYKWRVVNHKQFAP